MSSPNDEQSLFRRKRAHFKGSAKVPLSLLRSDASSTFTLDEKNVLRLVQIFKLEECHRLDPTHHVPATISHQSLEEALQNAGQEHHILMDSDDPPLIRPEGLTVLHGRHRLKAAQIYLDPNEQWWVVDLYDDNLPQQISISIQKEYANSRKLCDGDIYRILRHHQLNQNSVETGKWLARLSLGKQKDIQQLHKQYKDLSGALDCCLPIIGLWASLEIGTLHRILTMRCHEEMTHYVRHIERIWRQILPNTEYLSFVDPSTVTFLETLTPKFSKQDRTAVLQAMHNRTLFPQITEEVVRYEIFNRICEVQERIPSLFTFLENTKYLEPASKVLKNLFPSIAPRSERSLRDVCSRHFSIRERSNIPIQQSELVYTARNVTTAGCDWIAYRQLWLFAMRHFTDLTDILPRKNAGKPKPTHDGKRSVCTWFEFADLAFRLGYDSQQIRSLRHEDPDKNMVRSFLKQIRPDDLYNFSEEDRTSIIEQICAEVRRKSSVICSRVFPSLTTNEIGQPKSHRCGRPFEQDHYIDQAFLFVENIYGNLDIQSKEYLTSFAMKRDIFLSFFGNDRFEIFDDGIRHPDNTPSSLRQRDTAPTAMATETQSNAAGTQSNTGTETQSSTAEMQSNKGTETQSSTAEMQSNTGTETQSSTAGMQSNTSTGTQSDVIVMTQALNTTETIFPIITGFRDEVEDTASLNPAIANKIADHRRVSDVIHSYLSKCDLRSRTYTVLYLCHSREFFFYPLDSDSSEVLFHKRVAVWQQAKEYGLVIAGPKVTRCRLPYLGHDLEKFLAYIEE